MGKPKLSKENVALIACLQGHADEIFRLKMLNSALTEIVRGLAEKIGVPNPKFDELVRQTLKSAAETLGPKVSVLELFQDSLGFFDKNPTQH